MVDTVKSVQYLNFSSDIQNEKMYVHQLFGIPHTRFEKQKKINRKSCSHFQNQAA